MTIKTSSGLFQSALRRGFWKRLKRRVRQQPTYLEDFEQWQARTRLKRRTDCGVDSIPIKHIVGSLGRSREFDRDFMPLNDSVELRWQRLIRLYLTGITLPPIEVYLTDDGYYYIIDGNHRVSVSSFLNIEYVDAHVIRLYSNVSQTSL